jgi:hypothetical protein
MNGTTSTRLRSAQGTLLFGAAILAVTAPLGPLGCAKNDSAETGYGGSDASGPATDAQSDAVAAEAGSDASGASQDSGSAGVTLPFYVSNEFIPSGFMNDPTGISVSTGANGSAACPTRAPGAGGDCYVVSWTSTGAAWAGVYWQYPSNNWGTDPGLSVAPGAKQVSFYAQGAVGGEALTFKSGGINDPVNSANGSYGDTFQVSSPAITLTTTWTQYTISLQGADYAQGVLGAFVWVATATDGGNGDIKFYLDDITWE